MPDSTSLVLSSIPEQRERASVDVRLTEQLVAGGVDEVEVAMVSDDVRRVADLSPSTRAVLVALSRQPGFRVALLPGMHMSENEWNALGMGNAVAVDGIVPYEGSSLAQPGAAPPRLIVDHHRGPRFSQSSAALQLHALAEQGGLSPFRTEKGAGSLTLVCNHLDEDTAAAAYAAFRHLHPEHDAAPAALRARTAERVAALMKTVSDMDVWMGAAGHVTEYQQRELKFLNQPWRAVKTKRSPTALAAALRDTFARWQQLAEDRPVLLPHLRRQLALHVARGPYAVLRHVTPEARVLLRQDPINASFVLASVGMVNRRKCYSCLTYPECAALDKQALLHELNGAEDFRLRHPGAPVEEVVTEMRPSLSGHWGGNEAAGCAQSGSGFSLVEITQVVDEGLRRQDIDAGLHRTWLADQRDDVIAAAEERIRRRYQDRP